MSDYLPQEVLIQILARLPVKSLLRFRCVSKSWHCLITSESFMTRHLQQTTTNKSLLIFRYKSCKAKDKEENFLLYPHKDFPHNHIEILHCPFTSMMYHLNVVGSCNGLLCLADDLLGYSLYRAVLWNPSIRKIVTVPRPNVTFSSHGTHFHSQGFGFDPKSNDYKLVRIVYLQVDLWVEKVPPLVEVYSLRRGSWRMVPNDLNYVVTQNSPNAVVNGSCHWNARLVQNDRAHNVIVSFDLEEEVLRKIDLPDCLVSNFYLNINVAAFNGLLGLVPFAKWDGYGAEHLSIWVMKEYGSAESWIKILDLDNVGQIQRVVALKNNGEEVIMSRGSEEKECKLFRYNTGSKEVWSCGIQGNGNSFYLDDYVESLALLMC